MAETFIRVQIDIPYTDHEQHTVEHVKKRGAALLKTGDYDAWFVNDMGEQCDASNLDYDEDGGGGRVSLTKEALQSATHDERIAMLKAHFKEFGIQFSDMAHVFGVDRDSDPFASVAHENYGREGEIEVDNPVVLSESDEGAYVMAWVWVSNDDAGIEGGNAEEMDLKEGK